MKLFPLVSLLTIRIFIFLHFIVGSNYYLRQRYRPSVVYLYTYFTYIDILSHYSNQQWAWCTGYRVGLSRWRLRFDPLLGKRSFSFFFFFFVFFLILHFETLQDSIAFHLKFYYCYTVFIKTFEPPHDKIN